MSRIPGNQESIFIFIPMKRRKIRTPLSRYTARKVKWINASMGDLKAPMKKNWEAWWPNG